jgi:hypothetical protein
MLGQRRLNSSLHASVNRTQTSLAKSLCEQFFIQTDETAQSPYFGVVNEPVLRARVGENSLVGNRAAAGEDESFGNPGAPVVRSFLYDPEIWAIPEYRKIRIMERKEDCK